jgi:hypothetical protein
VKEAKWTRLPSTWSGREHSTANRCGGRGPSSEDREQRWQILEMCRLLEESSSR